MEDKDLRRYEMILRVRDFGAAHGSSFPPASLGAELFAAVGAAAAEMGAQVASRSSATRSARQGTVSKATARAALRESLEMIRRTARSMSITMPGLETKFRIPRGLTDQELLGTGQAFAADAAPLKNDFIRFALPADFLDDLNAHLSDFAAAMTSQHTGLGEQVEATAAFDDALESAMSAVRQLDAVARNTFHDDPARLAAWESARRVERAARTKTPDADAPPA